MQMAPISFGSHLLVSSTIIIHKTKVWEIIFQNKKIARSAGGATGPGQTLLHVTGHKKEGKVEENVKFFCTTNGTMEEISLKEEGINFSGFDPSKPLVIFTHGYAENYFKDKTNYMYPAIESE